MTTILAAVCLIIAIICIYLLDKIYAYKNQNSLLEEQLLDKEVIVSSLQAHVTELHENLDSYESKIVALQDAFRIATTVKEVKKTKTPVASKTSKAPKQAATQPEAKPAKKTKKAKK